jgi:hypothetical protein
MKAASSKRERVGVQTYAAHGIDEVDVFWFHVVGGCIPHLELADLQGGTVQ